VVKKTSIEIIRKKDLLPTTYEYGTVTFSVSGLSVCVTVCNALRFESLDLESLFLVSKYIFSTVMSSSYIKVIGSRSRSQS